MRLPGSDKVIVGYDLGKDYAQISCYVTGREEEITTLSSVAGSQVYTIPPVSYTHLTLPTKLEV